MRAALGLSLLAAGCGEGPTAATPDAHAATRAAFVAARARWASQGISSYEYSFRRLCFCADTEPVRIAVRDGRVSRVLSSRTGEPRATTGYPTIDDLFAELGAALDGQAYEIRASYDPGLGYPTSYFIDVSEKMADEEQRIEAGELERLR